MRQHGIVACGQVTLPLPREQLLDNERDIKSTVSNTRVSEVVQHALSQYGVFSQLLTLESHYLSFCECLSTMLSAYLTFFPRQSRLWHGLRIELCSQRFLFLCSQPLHVQGPDSTTQTFPHVLVGGMYKAVNKLVNFFPLKCF